MRDESYFSIIFGEGTDAVDIGKLLDAVTKVERNAGAGQEHTYSAGTGRFGKTWVSGRRSSYDITIEGQKTGSPAELLSLRTKLARALDCPDGPKKLQFDDQDGKYYIAVTSGQPKFTEDLQKSQATVSISFEVPDGLLHSELTKILTSKTNSPDIGSLTKEGNIVKMTLNNAGSAPAYPRIRIKNAGTNGWIGIVNKNGVMEIGTSSSGRDGAVTASGSYDQSQLLLNLTPNDSAGWRKGVNIGGKLSSQSPLAVANHAEISDLTLDWAPRDAGSVGYPCPGLHWTRSGSKGIGQDWGCAVYEYTLPADKNNVKGAKNFRCDFNLKLWASKIGQTGLLAIMFMDDNDRLICAYSLDKYTTDSDKVVQVFTTTDIHKLPREENEFGSNNNEPGQQRPNPAFNSRTGNAYVIKDGPKFTYGYNGIPKTIVDATKENLECTKIWVLYGRARSERPGTGHLDTLCVQSLKFQKTNVQRYDLVPNKYNAGSELVVDMYEGKISYIADPEASSQGVGAEGDLANGSRYFAIPPGESQLEIHSSGFVTTAPEVIVEWEEAWL